MIKIFAFLKYIYLRLFKTGLTLNNISYLAPTARIIIKNSGTISCLNSIRLDNNTELQSRGILNIGSKLVVNAYSRIIALERIEIGSNVVIARFVAILDHDHECLFSKDGETLSFNTFVTKSIKIGDNVLIGDKVTILKGVHIGNNVVIAANAVVNRSFPSNVMIGGVPARIIKYLTNNKTSE